MGVSSLLRAGWKAPAGATFQSCQVVACLHLVKTCMGKQATYHCRLVVTMLQQQPAAREEMGRSLRNDGVDVIESIATTGQGL